MISNCYFLFARESFYGTDIVEMVELICSFYSLEVVRLRNAQVPLLFLFDFWIHSITRLSNSGGVIFYLVFSYH